jgi:hypothetical protein
MGERQPCSISSPSSHITQTPLTRIHSLTFHISISRMHIPDSETRGDATPGISTPPSAHTVGPSQRIPKQNRDSTPPTDGAETITVYGVNLEADSHASPITAEDFDRLSALGLEIRKRARVEYKMGEEIVERYYVDNMETDADETLCSAAQSRMADLTKLIKHYHVFDLQ